MIEKEWKFKIKDIEGISLKLKNIGAEELKKVKQLDIYLDFKDRKLIKEKKAFRLRFENGKALLSYKGEMIQREPKMRIEESIELDKDKAEILLDMLKNIGLEEVARIVKERKSFIFKNFKIFLDEVKGLGRFIEIEEISEQKQEGINDLIERLGIKEDEYIKETYPELLFKNIS